jgi:membrane fusion protein, copper/silver efflux system
MTIQRKYVKPFVLLVLMLAIAGTATSLLTGCGPSNTSAAGEEGNKTLYTCGMHPQVVQDKPGNCPICGMKLTAIRKPTASAKSSAATAPGERKIKYYKSSMTPGEISPTPRKDNMGMDMVPVYEDEAAAAESQTIAVDPATTQTMGIRTATVTRGPLRRTIRTVGAIDYNETALVDVTTKFKGWIEKLYVDATGQQVHRGDPLFEIYSPELYSAQREYLLAIEERGASERESVGASTLHAPAAPRSTIATSAITKLKFFDISDEQIAELQRTGQPSKTLRILAPIDGFVMDKMVVQGQMVDPGMKMYRLADLGLVWVQAQIYEQDLDYIKLGQEVTVTLSYLSDREFRGRVTYIYPNVDEKTRTARVRMEFHNPGYFLKPGMFVTVQVVSELEPSVLLVPDMAILRSGEKNTVFVALEEGKFEPRTITLGPQAENDMYQVLSGLKEGERIVTSGQFMLDSESQLREAIQKMLKPKEAAAVAPSTTATNTMPGVEHEGMPGMAPASANAVVKYICPMPEHVSIQYDHPGKCPICGMTLVPVTSAALAKLQPGGKLLYYTCPMPEHSDVRSDKPGKCPKCGMTLIPVMLPPPTDREKRGASGALERERVGAASTLDAPNTPRSPTLYTCPMADHADVVADKPSKCPKCEMDLVPTSSVAHGKIAEENWRKQHPSQPAAGAAAMPEHHHSD